MTLIPEARQWWRMASNWLAILWGAFVAVIVAVNPGALIAAYATVVQLPPGLPRIGGALLAFIGFAGIPIMVRLWSQGGAK